jgi:PhnB protein
VRISSQPGKTQLASVVPQLSVRGGRAAVDFYKAAFGAEVAYQVGGTAANESIVAELSLGGASFWVADESPPHGNFSPESVGGSTTRMLLIVDDPAGAIERAVAAGAALVYAVHKEHGWLLGRISDPFGHHWEVGKPLVPWPPASGGPGGHHAEVERGEQPAAASSVKVSGHAPAQEE